MTTEMRTEPEPTAWIRTILKEDRAEVHGDLTTAEPIIDWVMDDLRNRWGPGVFDLFLETADVESRLVQPSLEDVLDTPMCEALRSAQKVAEYIGKQETASTEFWGRLLSEAKA